MLLRLLLHGNLLVLGVLGGTCRCVAGDWPTYQYDNSRRGRGPEQLELPLRLQWDYTSPQPPETAWEGPRSEPFEGLQMRHRVDFDQVLPTTIAEDLLYFGSSVDNKVCCVDVRSGTLQWQYLTDGPVRLVPTVAHRRVYFGADDGFVYCLNATSGALIWKQRGGPDDDRLLARGRMISRWPIRTGVVVEGDVAYFGAGVLPHEKVYLYAVRAEDGSVVWCNDTISQQDAGRNPLSPQGYLLCSSERLIVPSGRALPAAFDRQDGHELYQRVHSWRSAAGGVVGGTRAVLADGQIYASGPHHFLALDEKTGAVGFAWVTGRQLVIGDELAFVADGEHIVCLDRAQHVPATRERQELRMEMRELQSQRARMDAEQYNTRLRQLRERESELSQAGFRWQTPCPADAALIVSGHTVFAGGRGKVWALDAQQGTILWEAPVEGNAGGLAVASGRLFVSTTLGKIYCFADARQTLPQTQVKHLPADPIQNPYPEDELSDVYVAAADMILRQTKIERGYCLVLGAGQGRLAYELSRRSQLRIYGIEPDRAQAKLAQQRLDRAGLHGTRITILHGDPSDMPFSNYFANLVVSDQFLLTGNVPGTPEQVRRRLKPLGGTFCLALPDGAPASRKAEPFVEANSFVADLNLRLGTDIQRWSQGLALSRGALPGAGQWSHQYGDAANTMTSLDQRVRGDLGVLWYGDPGPNKMINRHDAAAAPLSTRGRMFVQAFESILAYDAYNGLFLWEYRNPGAIRTGVFNNEDTSNFAASDDHVFVVVDDTCTVLDAASGRVVRTYRVPESPDGVHRVWGFVAHYDGMLLGTSTLRKELDRSLRRRGLQVDKATDALFAIDLQSGQRKWVYRGGSIEHVTIAVGDDRVFFIDSSITREQRRAQLQQDKSPLQALDAEQAAEKEAELKKLDLRLATCLDVQTGKPQWSRPVDVTDCSRVGIGGGNLTLMYHDGHVVVCGANANGHYWRQFLSGQFSRRRLVVLDAASGATLWAKDANYRHRPIIVGNEIVAEPWAFDLHTGTEKMREHPLTGKPTVWQFSRPGHHCGPITATPNMLFFRSGFTGYYDLYDDSGTTHFAGQRLGCWVNAIPGNGLLMVPEASAGCVCQFSLAATIVMEPRPDRDRWRIYSATGANTPVRHLALNLGAPGDRRDANGTLWLAYPRPKTVGRLEYTLSVATTLAPGGGWYCLSEEATDVSGAEAPWVLTSGVRGLERCEIPLRSEDEAAASYTVSCYFAAIEGGQAQPAPFDIKLQGNVMAHDVEILAEAGGAKRQVKKTFEGVRVEDALRLELVPKSDRLPAIAGIEVRRQ